MDWVELTDEFNSVIYNINHTDNNYFITGKAGTLILFDASLIHRGRPLEEGCRYALTNYYYP